MSSTNDPDTQPGLQWNPTIDKMMANWCDQSKCFNWMHTQGYSRYSARATAMNISTNIFISLTGIVNIILGSVLSDKTVSSMSFGSISIVIGVAKMIQDQFDWTTLANDFKRSAEKWDIITRKIQEQLLIPYSGRKDCRTFLKYIKQDINNASDTNLIIPKDIRNQCNIDFGQIKDFDVPDICGQVEHTIIFIPDEVNNVIKKEEANDNIVIKEEVSDNGVVKEYIKLNN
jgi:hypothetical protein